MFIIAVTGGAIILQSQRNEESLRPIVSQSKSIRDELDIMQQEARAWIGPTAIAWANPSSVDEPLKVSLSYRNFGRQPATHVYDIETTRLPINSISTLADIKKLPFWGDKTQFDPDALCGAKELNRGDSTVFPSDLNTTAESGIRNDSPVTAGASISLRRNSGRA